MTNGTETAQLASTETAETKAATTEVEPAEVKEIDWKAEARKHEQRAKDAAARAKANEAAAQRLAELENANKTAEQIANDRIAAAEERAAELEAIANRATVANAAGLPADLIAGPASNSPEDLQAFADKLIAFRAQATVKPSAASFIEGTNKVTPEPDLNAAIAEAQAAGNWKQVIALQNTKLASQSTASAT